MSGVESQDRAMSDPAAHRMTADEFIAWAMEQPEGRHYELLNGEVVAMAPERTVHTRVKFRVARRLADAVEAAGLPCEVFTEGQSVRIDQTTVYDPDALIHCGSSLPDDGLGLSDPLVVIEVLSPSTRSRDEGRKLIDYFRLPSLQHYVILRPGDRAIIHHARNTDGTILTRIIRDGTLRLEPPGITINDVFPPPA